MGQASGAPIVPRSTAVWSPLIQRNVVTENTAGESLRGDRDLVSAWRQRSSTTTSPRNTAIYGDGGGVYYRGRDSGGAIVRNLIVGNYAGDHGGGVYAGSTPQGTQMGFELSWNLVSGNQATVARGPGTVAAECGSGQRNVGFITIRSWSNAGHGEGSPNGGGVAILQPSTPVIEQNIIAFSQAGGGIWCSGESTPIIRNNLAWQNTGGDGVGSCPTWWQSNGNIVADPLFCNRAGGDYSLTAGSPALTHPAGPLGALSTPGCQAPAAPRPTTHPAPVVPRAKVPR